MRVVELFMVITPEGSTSAPLELPPLTISDGFKAPATDKSSADKTDTSKPASEATQKHLNMNPLKWLPHKRMKLYVPMTALSS